MAPNIKDKQAKTICENPNISNLNRAVASCSNSCEGGNGDVFKNTGNKIPGIGIETLKKITKVLRIIPICCLALEDEASWIT